MQRGALLWQVISSRLQNLVPHGKRESQRMVRIHRMKRWRMSGSRWWLDHTSG